MLVSPAAPPVLEAAPPASAALATLVEPAAPLGAELIGDPTAGAALPGDRETGVLPPSGSACPWAAAPGMLSGAVPLPPCVESFAFRAPTPGPVLGAGSLPHAMALSANTYAYTGERNFWRVICMA